MAPDSVICGYRFVMLPCLRKNRLTAETVEICENFWSRRSGLNGRPADYESAALPTELRRLAWWAGRHDLPGAGNVSTASRIGSPVALTDYGAKIARFCRIARRYAVTDAITWHTHPS